MFEVIVEYFSSYHFKCNGYFIFIFDIYFN